METGPEGVAEDMPGGDLGFVRMMKAGVVMCCWYDGSERFLQ